MSYRKLFIGLLTLFLGVFQIANLFLQNNYLTYIFNYQFVLFLIGIYLLLNKEIDNFFGYIIILFSVFSYAEEFLDFYYIPIIIPILSVIIGFGLLFSLVYKLSNKNKKVEEKEN